MISYSFDIFDTCLVRTCGSPQNVFEILALNILGNDCDSNTVSDFINIRLSGELQARNNIKGEITIEEIYSYCDFSGISRFSNHDIMERELDIEYKILIPVFSISQKIKQLHDKNIPVMFISDMYMHEDFLKKVLIKNGIWKNGDKLYVSSEYRKTKNEGSLFDYIAKENNIKFKNWIHYGDNIVSDYKVPKRKGIKVRLVNNSYSEYENNLLHLSIFSDSFDNQRMAGLQRALRLSEKKDSLTELSVNITIPTILMFVLSVLKDAEINNIKKLYFMARDGAFPYHIAKLLSDKYRNIEVYYMYASRTALYFPSIKEVNKESIIELLGNLKGKNIIECFIDKTNINIKEFVPEKLHKYYFTNHEEGISTISKLFNNINFIKLIKEEHTKQHSLCKSYLRQIGILNDKNTNIGIVDIRGSRNCHIAINNILELNGGKKVKGYYFEVINNRKNSLVEGEYWAYFHTERCILSDSNLKYISDLYSVIEQYFCAIGDKRTIGYQKDVNGRIIPIFEDNSDCEIKNEIFNIHTHIANNFVNLASNISILNNPEKLFPLIQYNLIQFSKYPTLNNLLAIKDIKVNDSKFDYSNLIIKHPIIDLFKRDFNRNEWRRGSILFSLYNIINEKIISIILKSFNK